MRGSLRKWKEGGREREKQERKREEGEPETKLYHLICDSPLELSAQTVLGVEPRDSPMQGKYTSLAPRFALVRLLSIFLLPLFWLLKVCQDETSVTELSTEFAWDLF